MSIITEYLEKKDEISDKIKDVLTVLDGVLDENGTDYYYSYDQYAAYNGDMEFQLTGGVMLVTHSYDEPFCDVTQWSRVLFPEYLLFAEEDVIREYFLSELDKQTIEEDTTKLKSLISDLYSAKMGDVDIVNLSLDVVNSGKDYSLYKHREELAQMYYGG